MGKLLVLFVAIVVLASLVSAESEGGIMNSLMKIIQSILSMFGVGGKHSQTTTTTQPFCESPYIQVGDSCCLDANSNDVCDRDEETTTTVEETTSTVVTTTTTESTTTTERATTTTIAVRCRRNLDCGEAREVRVCYKSEVYLKKVTPICRNPGKAESECIEKTAMGEYPLEDCVNGCSEGECVS